MYHRRERGGLPFWSNECQTRLRHNRAAWRRWRRSGRVEDYVTYRKIQAQTKKFLKKRRRESYYRFAAKVNLNCTRGGAWRILKGLQEPTYRPSVTEFKIISGQSEEEAKKEGEEFFTEIFQEEEEVEMEVREESGDEEQEMREVEERARREEREQEARERVNGNQSGERREETVRDRYAGKLWTPFTMAELQWALDQTANKAPGEDGLTAQMLKSLSARGMDRILEILNKSRETGEVPRAWKRGKIVLIPKPGRDLGQIKNWRPICLTSVLGKVMEKLVNRRMMWYLEETNFFLEEQHGFRWNHSTQDALAEFTGEIRQALQAGDSVAVVHLDVEAAYTSVDIRTLKQDLREMGLPIGMIRWFDSYLEERVVTVKLGESCVTGDIPMTRGLMQGSVLSPTLWNIFTRFMLKGLSDTVVGGGFVVFADDVTVWGRHTAPALAVAAATTMGEEVRRRCRSRKLQIKLDKCQAVLHSQRKHLPRTMKWDQVDLEIKTRGKLLGVIVDQRLTGEAHVTEVVRKCVGRLAWLRAVRGVLGGLDTKQMLGLYRGFVRSVVDYAAVALGHMSVTQMKKLGRVETAGLRMCLAAFYGTANTALYVEAFELPIDLRWDGIRSKQAATRSRFERSDTGGGRPPALGNHAKRMREEGLKDHVRARRGRGWFPRADGGTQAEKVPFREEEELVQAGPCAVLPGKKKDLSTAAVRAAALYAVAQTRGADLVLYTDGSLKTEGAGAGFWGSAAGATWAGVMPTWSGVLTSEMVAIESAVRFGANMSSAGLNLVIMTDSKGAWTQVLSGKGHKNSNQEVRENIYCEARKIVDRGGSVKVGWIPSHCGIEGNDRADKLAAKGALEMRGAEIVQTPPTKKEVALWAKDRAVKEWQKRWDRDRLGRYRWRVDPELGVRKKKLKLTRREDVLWNRLRLGTARLAQWRKTVLREGDGMCDGCRRSDGVGVVGETLRHCLLRCPAWDAQRERMWNRLLGRRQDDNGRTTNDSNEPSRVQTAGETRIEADLDDEDPLPNINGGGERQTQRQVQRREYEGRDKTLHQLLGENELPKVSIKTRVNIIRQYLEEVKRRAYVIMV